jgi:hypothetical protein
VPLAVSVPEILGLTIGLVGLAGVVFTALSWRRNDTKTMVDTQASIVGEMQVLNGELRATADRLRAERDDCTTEVARLRRDLHLDG